ncbi:autotransporter outer membrane beta-barrel domain-containing protein [Bradyrhizobium sp. 199]|uniref:autotransporter outer membrane beta-barrel domain-containing protein n=1 Tax=Bradyrhizobium sp. 199 TaxID=2782664 RepID=UPI001FF8B9BA|nr:autotransporter outer membrane beta-barrel domain-containing protein [Bradyrhizobium sp. 199]MCK1360027.1 autotransporter domain-containing protein [Bradyrhizobium sp. 199]
MARAQVWQNGGVANGNYNEPTNWSTNTVPDTAGETATFSNTGTAAVTITVGPISPQSWIFDAASQGYAIGGQAVNFVTGITNNAGGVGTFISISNNMTGASISQAGSSRLTLSGTNSFTNTSVTGGTFINTGSLTTSLTVSAIASNQGTLIGDITTTTGFSNLAAGIISATTIANNGGTFFNNGSITTTGGTTNAAGATFNTTGTVNGGLTNSGTVNARGVFNDGITNQGSGSFALSGDLTTNGAVTNNATSSLAAQFGSFTGITTLTNNSSSATAVQVAAGRTLSATSIVNNAGTFTNGGTVTTTAGTTNAAGGTFTTTGTVNGGLTNSGTANAAGTINGNVDHQSGAFTVTGALAVNGTLTTGAISDLFVSGGDLTVTTLINQSSAMIHATWIDAGRTINATSVTNNGNLAVTGTLNATNTISNAIGANIVVDPTGTINGSINAAGGYTQLYGTINGNVTLSGSLASMNTYGGSVTGRVDMTAAGANVYSTSGGATYGSLAGVAGSQLNTGAFVFTVGGDNSTSLFAGSISGTGSFVKTGSGALILSGDSSGYTGTTTVDGGTLVVSGSMASSALTTVNPNGYLTGNGAVGAALIAGGYFSPGAPGGPGTSMAVTSLVMQPGAYFNVFVDPTTSTFANVAGNATLGGATVSANFAAGSYVAKQYTILNAASITDTFSPTVTNVGLPSGFHTSLSYDATHAYLNLALNFAPPAGDLNRNQQSVGNAIINYFNATGTIPIVFGGLTPASLTQLSGEVGSAPQQATFNAMDQFMGVMTGPFIAGRGDPVGAGGTPNAYADETALAYARKRKPNDALAAIYTKAPVAPSFEQRWSVWAAGFGGAQQTDGNAVVGSNNTRSNLYGTAVGADYRISRDTLVGFALAGGGTNFTVANALGGGRSDLFQAGAFFRHGVGAAYITGALAYGWHDITTDRTVTVAGVDRLRAEFNANAYSGRLEGGYRFVTQGVGLTPYAAAQFTTFDLPAYAEQAIVGSNQFALAYRAKSATDTRTELGLRTDKSFAQADGIVTLRGRLAWAHDFNPDRAIGATFQTLPGASFVVNGAAMASDSALVTGSVEKKWLNGWSAAGTFEGEFSNVTRSYAGKGVVRYAW